MQRAVNQHRHGYQYQQAQLPIHDQHDDCSNNQQQRAIQDADGCAPGQKADAFDILDGAGKQLSGLGLIVEGKR